VTTVLRGFLHVLKVNGFAEVIVPDIQAVAKHMIDAAKDIEDELYISRDGDSISIRDVIYGYGPEIEKSGQDFYAHKTGFTPRSLKKKLEEIGFEDVQAEARYGFEIHAVGFKRKRT
jgi:hypothetical protein